MVILWSVGVLFTSKVAINFKTTLLSDSFHHRRLSSYSSGETITPFYYGLKIVEIDLLVGANNNKGGEKDIVWVNPEYGTPQTSIP